MPQSVQNSSCWALPDAAVDGDVGIGVDGDAVDGAVCVSAGVGAIMTGDGGMFFQSMETHAMVT